MRAALAHIRDWVFDLDNTLYPAPTLYDAIGERMTSFIAARLELDHAAALDLRERYFHQYGATVVGLAKHHALDPHAFLAYVHDVDYSVLAPEPELANLIAALPGRKIVFTNGGGGHGQRVIDRLGLTNVFERVFDIEAASLAPKPQREAYERLIATCEVTPARAMLIEDTLRNLEPAYELGFETALVGAVHPQPRLPYVGHWGEDVKALLRAWLD